MSDFREFLLTGFNDDKRIYKFRADTVDATKVGGGTMKWPGWRCEHCGSGFLDASDEITRAKLSDHAKLHLAVELAKETR